jgi:hypothetical protein
MAASRACFGLTCIPVVLLSVAAVAAAVEAAPLQEPNYAEYYAKGMTFAQFLEQARARRDEWRSRYNDATVTADLVTRLRALPERRRILVVSEDWCFDSANTIPYLARLVDGAPERLEMRIIGLEIGRPIMEAHRTPDGRAATPTVIVLDERGRITGAWTERPSAAQTWFLERQKVTMQEPLHDQLEKWYEDDAGKTTMAEIAAILER